MLTSLAGSRLFGETYGVPPRWVLALHGWRRDHEDFGPLLEGPPPLDAVAPDLPGFGGTPPPEAAWGSRQYAEALLPLLDEMAPSVVVLGHSLGGRIAVHLASLAPQRISGVVLTGAPLFRAPGSPTTPALRFRVARRLARSGLVGEETLERYRQRYGSSDYRAASGVMRQVLVGMLAERYDDELARLTCPVELVWGDGDTAAPLSVATQIRDALPGRVRLTVCEGTGHFTPTSVPGELRQALERLRP